MISNTLEGLEGFTQLHFLKLKTEDPLTGFVISQRLESLRELSLSGHFTNMNGVEQCPNLEYMAIEACHDLSKHHLDPLKALTKLHTLSMRSLCFIPCLEGLNELQVLKIHSISGDLLDEDTIQDLKLESLKKLRSLSMVELHPIKSFKHIGALPSLEELSLSKIYRLESLEGLDGLPSLHTLRLEKLEQLKPSHMQILERLPKLKKLSLKRCPKLLNTESLLPLISRGIVLHLEPTSKDLELLQDFINKLPKDVQERVVLEKSP